ncbi:MAG TPA: YIP1 family protein [Edaphocola sp.]|nr:YIP1 family protein [Edaphocola sp.]
MIQEILFNPFKKLAGSKALGIGLAILLVTAVIAGFSHCHFDGALDAHMGADLPAWVYYLEALIAWGITALVFYLTGVIFSTSKIRLVDVLGTTALARYPFFFMAILGFGMPEPTSSVGLPFANTYIVISLLSVLIAIWNIALLYHAFSVSCNLKKSKGVKAFIVALIVAEIISKIAFYFLYLNF